MQAAPVLRRLADELVAEANVPIGRMLGAGLALPVRFGVGAITNAGPTTLQDWDEVDGQRHIEQALGLPVLIENDAMAASDRRRLHGGRPDDRELCLPVHG